MQKRKLFVSGRSIVASGLVLLLFAAISTTLVTGIHGLTYERIVENERQAFLASVSKILPTAEYDNDPLEDQVSLPSGQIDPDAAISFGYRARQGVKPVAVILNMVAKNGYNGDIYLLVAVREDQSIAGVDVLSHKETPGLGDRIEAKKSTWLEQFAGRFLDSERSPEWGVKRDGGDFDQLTGATITPRAVVNAVRAALDFTSRNHRLLFETV